MAKLTTSERREIERLARLVQQAVRVPWLAVDIGQLQGGEWRLIEIADAQFAGLCQASALGILNALMSRDTERPAIS